jgi:hypothetical protein
MSLVPIAEFSDRIAADVARIGLAAEGIEAVLFDGGMAGLGLGFMTPVRLMVHPDDAARALSLIEPA